MKYTLEIIIDKESIEVDEDGFYGFDYTYREDGGKLKDGRCDGDFDGQTAKQFKKVLLDGEALNLARQEVAENHD